MCVVAMFLPLVSLPIIDGVNGFKGDAWPVVFALIVPVGLALVGDKAEGFGPATAIAAILSGALAVVFSVAKLVDARLAAEAARDVGAAGIGPGAWLLVTGAIVVLVGAVASTSRSVAA